MVIDAIGAFLNTILITAMLVDPLKVFAKGASITILNLAIADLISSAANFLHVGLSSRFHVTNSKAYYVVRFFLIFGVSASFALLTTLTVETYIVTKYPIKGRIMLTKKKTVILCMVSWFLAMPLGLSNIAYLFTDNISILMKIYVAQIAILETAVVVQVIFKFLIIQIILTSGQNTEQQNGKHKKIAKTIVILVIILIVTALPFFISKQLEFLWTLRLISGDSTLILKFSNYYEPIAAINYVANPILYALRFSDYRRTLLVLFTKCRGKVSLFPACITGKKSVNTATTLQQQSVTTEF